MALAARDGLVDAGSNTGRLANGEYGLETWQIFLTMKGWELLEKFDRPILHRWAANLWENLPTVVVSIMSAVAIAYLKENLLEKEQAPPPMPQEARVTTVDVP